MSERDNKCVTEEQLKEKVNNQSMDGWKDAFIQFMSLKSNI